MKRLEFENCYLIDFSFGHEKGSNAAGATDLSQWAVELQNFKYIADPCLRGYQFLEYIWNSSI